MCVWMCVYINKCILFWEFPFIYQHTYKSLICFCDNVHYHSCLISFLLFLFKILVSVCFYVCLAWLLTSEIHGFIHQATQTPLISVDGERNKKIKINFDITFPHVACPSMLFTYMNTQTQPFLFIRFRIQIFQLIQTSCFLGCFPLIFLCS